MEGGRPSGRTVGLPPSTSGSRRPVPNCPKPAKVFEADSVVVVLSEESSLADNRSASFRRALHEVSRANNSIASAVEGAIRPVCANGTVSSEDMGDALDVVDSKPTIG
jgi:hypothetical protein